MKLLVSSRCGARRGGRWWRGRLCPWAAGLQLALRLVAPASLDGAPHGPDPARRPRRPGAQRQPGALVPVPAAHVDCLTEGALMAAVQARQSPVRHGAAADALAARCARGVRAPPPTRLTPCPVSPTARPRTVTIPKVRAGSGRARLQPRR